MKKRIVTIMAAAVLLAGLSGAQQQSTASGTQYARAVLTILTDPQASPMPAEEDQIEILLLTAPSPETNAQNGSDLAAANGRAEIKLLEKPWDFKGLQMTRLELLIPLDEKNKAGAKQLTDAYVNRVQQALDRQYENHCTLCQDKQTSYAEQVRQAELRFTQLVEQQQALPKGTVDTESFRRRAQDRDGLLAENAVEQAVLKKRVEELSAYINRVQEQPAPLSEDAAGRQLRDQIDELETRLKKEEEAEVKNQEHGFDTPVLRDRIAQAKFLLADRQSQLQDQAAQEVRQLEQQRHEAMMQLEELAAKQEAIEASDTAALADSIQYEILEVRIQAAKEALHDALAEAQKFDAQMNTLQRPVVNYTDVVFSAEPQI